MKTVSEARLATMRRLNSGWAYASSLAAQPPDAPLLARLAGAYAVIRDPTCRLFGYHGLLGEGGAFSLDHMFGF